MPAYRIGRFGWLPDPFDHRDLKFTDKPVKAALAKSAARKGSKIKKAKPAELPGKVDLRSECPPVEDQETIGACTAHAVVGLLEYVWKQDHGHHVDASRLFLYKVTRNLLGWDGDTGAFVRTTIKASKLFGVCPEDYWPYDVDTFDEEPPAFCYSFARAFLSLAYFRVEPKVAKLKEVLAHNIPFAFGFTCFESIDDDETANTGIIPFPGPSEANVGGHAIMAVGYDDHKKAFIIRNSWSREWGEKGYGFLPYRYFEEELADDCWCILRSRYDDLDNIDGN